MKTDDSTKLNKPETTKDKKKKVATEREEE